MKLKTLATILIGILSVLIVGVSAALMVMTTALHKASTKLLESNRSITASLELKNSLRDYALESLLWNSTGDPKHLAQRRQAQESLIRLFDESRRYVTSSEEAQLLRSAEIAVNAYLDERTQLESSASGAIDPPGRIPEKMDDALQNLRSLALLNIEQAEAAYTTSAMHNEVANVLGIIITTLALAVVPILFILLRKSVYKPMQQLAQAIQSLRQGIAIQTRYGGIEELQRISEAFAEMATELQKQTEARVRYLAAVAHDLRNPISAIKMSADITVTRYQAVLPAKVLELLQVIQRQATHLNRMIGDLLDTVRSEGGELELKKEIQDLRLIVKEGCNLFCNYSQDHRIVAVLDDSPVPAHIDSSRISQVINNLISNAIKYSPYGGEVLVTLTKEKNDAVLSVKDKGIGIAKSERDSIFEPFRRASATKDTIPGVGLGLFTSKKIVIAHGGRIELTSEIGAGSTFIIRIPLAEMPMINPNIAHAEISQDGHEAPLH